jgi:hypothetical protein
MAGRFEPQWGSVASAAFTHAGRAYAVGEPFPHKTLGLTRLDLIGLWRTALIQFVDPAVVSAPPVVTADLDLDRMSPEQFAELEVATASPPVATGDPAPNEVQFTLAPGDHYALPGSPVPEGYGPAVTVALPRPPPPPKHGNRRGR